MEVKINSTEQQIRDVLNSAKYLLSSFNKDEPSIKNHFEKLNAAIEFPGHRNFAAYNEFLINTNHCWPKEQEPALWALKNIISLASSYYYEVCRNQKIQNQILAAINTWNNVKSIKLEQTAKKPAKEYLNDFLNSFNPIKVFSGKTVEFAR